jgi:ergothioneine biosynthesis protein EgtB
MHQTHPVSSDENISKQSFIDRYKAVRARTVDICSKLKAEDMVVQPIEDVSPPKWHLAHSTWFFETFLLSAFSENYKVFDTDFGYLFNSYYNTIGERVLRANRGNLSRPITSVIMRYRAYVDSCLTEFLENTNPTQEQIEIIELGLQHEMQHQELLLTDIKYILGMNPTFPRYDVNSLVDTAVENETGFLSIAEGVYPIGYEGQGFCFDNELGCHKVYIHDFQIAKSLVTFNEYIEFIEAGGYQDFKHWHAEGWDWVKKNQILSPMHMYKVNGEWMRYSLSGFQKVVGEEVLVHVNYYEAAAFATWKGMRLPTEFEWEVAADNLKWGKAWEWTNSAYLPYPKFNIAEGAIGEYNGKFMVNQMVLRGASGATFPGHSRKSYRNFFHPHLQWQFSGIRLAK